MPAENPDTFNQRLSQWVANQGFWFQLRYSLVSGGSRGVILAHMFRFTLRLLIVGVVLALAGGIYLWRLPGTESFRENLETGLNRVLGASETKMSGFQQVQGEMMIRRLVSEGGKDTFFSLLEARNLKGRMGLFDLLRDSWQLGVLSVSELDLTINAGADDEEGANRIAQILFQQPQATSLLDTIDALRCSIRWGFSERTLGRLVNSHVRVQRIPSGWRVQANGGQFSQGWLKELEVIELVAVCTPDGITFEKAEFRKGPGTVTFTGLRLKAGSQPALDGTLAVSMLPIEGLLQPEVREWIDGSLTGEFRISGSTNTEDGIILDGEATLSDSSPLLLMDRIYLLRALSDFSVLYNFKTVMFTEGSFKMRTQGGAMQVSDVTIRGWGGGKGRQTNRPAARAAAATPVTRKPEDSITLSGAMTVRLPTREEAEASRELNRAGDPVERARMLAADSFKEDEDLEISLRKAAEAARKERERASGKADLSESAAVFERVEQSFQARLLMEQTLARQSRTLTYEGGFILSAPGEVFANNPVLSELFPPDPATGRVNLQVPLGGDLYTITHKQAEELYYRGERYGGNRTGRPAP